MALKTTRSFTTDLARALALALLTAGAPAAVATVSVPAMAQDAEPATVTELVAAVGAAYKDVNSLRADFVQVTRSPAMGEGEKQRGKVQLMRPRSMRWDFSSPDVKLFVTDGKTMWVYTPADKQVFVTEDLGGDDKSSGGMDQLLGNLENLDEYFDVTLLDRQGGSQKASYVLELVPKSDMQFKKLRLELDHRHYGLERLVIVDAFDNETDLSFSNLKLNPTLDPSVFTFVVPAGIQVVRADGL
ncbi:MAG: outer membrane lipoprotein carrier protein LolA [Oligoflexia bacterium]|nr:outer membrane lipoprotein carrier protein LolA [Oligoflexia bacterium]